MGEPRWERVYDSRERLRAFLQRERFVRVWLRGQARRSVFEMLVSP